MNESALENLFKAARQAHRSVSENPAETAPLGFASRVVAQAKRGNGWRSPGPLDLLERLGWCGAAASAAICLLALTMQSQPPSSNPFEILLEAPANTGEPAER